MLRRTLFYLASGFCLISTAGCHGTAWPDLFNTENVEGQRRKAERFDPYPETNAGPTVDGSRPRGYEQNWSETARSRYVLPSARPQ